MVNTSRSLFRETLDAGEILGVFLMDKGGEVASIIENHVERLTPREGGKSLLDTPVVLFLGLALPSKDGNAGGSNPNTAD